MSVLVRAGLFLYGVATLGIAVYMFRDPTYWLHDTWLVEEHPGLGAFASLFVRVGSVCAALLGLGSIVVSVLW